MSDRRLAVYLDGTAVGTLVQSSTGRLGCTYHRGYASPTAIPLSLSLPLGRSSHPPKAIGAFLAGLLPDSEPTLERWGRQFGVSPRNPFALLAHVGRTQPERCRSFPRTPRRATPPPGRATSSG
ncbi:HipA N-terminal domain-containing protein [Jiangella mangrovi]|uniref:HipA N-terminal domain-containing protein n=1 Tax=Jiangella mangrovi TaxID=1524084 RepID=UPI00160F6F01